MSAALKFCCISFDSYIKPQLICEFPKPTNVVYLLIPTSNHNCNVIANVFRVLYFFWFLHQTTTNSLFAHLVASCISFDSYIKPQLLDARYCAYSVVYLLIPTSNHNSGLAVSASPSLYIFWFLHQTTTSPGVGMREMSCISFDSYIKPQPVRGFLTSYTRCISFDSYIKPQPGLNALLGDVVVYLLIPTSNHKSDFLLVYVS